MGDDHLSAILASMSARPFPAESLVPAPGALTLTDAEIDAVLEIAFVTITADREIHPDERAAFSAVASRVRALSASSRPGQLAAIDDAATSAILKRFGRSPDRDALGASIARLAAKLEKPDARELAYRIALALAAADRASADEEFELDLHLVDALGLTSDRARELAGDVDALFAE
jgi:tellurite resistance protein